MPTAMRKTARGRVKCLVGLAVAVGLVTLLSPLPFTSSTPRLKGHSPTSSSCTPNPFNLAQTERDRKRSGNGGNAGGCKDNAGVDIKNSGGSVDENGRTTGNEDNGEKKNVNTGGKEENQGVTEQTKGKINENEGEKSEDSGGTQITTNRNGNAGETNDYAGVSQVNSGVNKEIIGLERRNNQIFPKSPVEQRVEEKVEEEVHVEQEELELSHDSYIQNIPPEEWVEVKKIKPKGGGGGIEGGGKGGGGKKTKRPGKRKLWEKKSLEKPLGLSPKQLHERAASLPASSPVREFLREQTRRRAHMAKSCRAFQPSLAEVVAGSRGPPVGLLAVRDIIYDRKNQLTFCPVYKAASTSWTITLLQLAGHWTKNTEKQPLQKVVKMFYPKLTGLAAASITANTTHFMVVRHPLERLLSCYRDKFQLATKDYYYHMFGEKIVRRFREALQHMPNEKVIVLQEEVRRALMSHRKQHGEGAMEGDFLNLPHNPFANPVGPTFPEFAHYVATTKYDDEHWRSYATHCAPCTLAYDFVLRFESLQEETQWFLEYLNRTGEVTPRWDNHNRKAETGSVFCLYYSQLPLELIDRLVDKYRKDLIMYEYDAEDYRQCAKDYPSSSSTGGSDSSSTGGSGGGESDATTAAAATTTNNGALVAVNT